VSLFFPPMDAEGKESCDCLFKPQKNLSWLSPLPFSSFSFLLFDQVDIEGEEGRRVFASSIRGIVPTATPHSPLSLFLSFAARRSGREDVDRSFFPFGQWDARGLI